jgi:hypothetical protein
MGPVTAPALIDRGLAVVVTGRAGPNLATAAAELGPAPEVVASNVTRSDDVQRAEFAEGGRSITPIGRIDTPEEVTAAARRRVWYAHPGPASGLSRCEGPGVRPRLGRAGTCPPTAVLSA